MFLCMKKLTSLAAAVLLSGAASLFGQSSAERLKALEAAMQKEMEARKPAADADADTDVSGRRGVEMGRMILGQLRAAVARGALGQEQTEQVLSQLPAYFSSEAVKKEAESLAAELRKEREEKESAELAQIQSAIKQAGDAVRSAKKPADLDAALGELAKFRAAREGVYASSPKLRAALNETQAAQQFAARWQDYLAALDAGNRDSAISALQSATSYSENVNIIPRSEILARLEDLKKQPRTSGRSADGREESGSTGERVSEIMAKTKTLGDMAAAIKALRKLQNEPQRTDNFNGYLISATLGALSGMEKTYREFLAGFPTGIVAPGQGNEANAAPEIVPLKAQLLMLVLPRFLNLPADMHPKPGEAVQPFLERIIVEARNRGDGALVARTREAQNLLVRGSASTTGISGDAAALAEYNAGRNREAAGEWMLAVMSYENALKIGSDAVPAKAIGERLAAIRAAHPKDYEMGVEHMLNPPPSNYPNPYFPRPMMPPAGAAVTPPHAPVMIAIPGGPPAGEQGKAAVSPSPAVSPLPAASVSPSPAASVSPAVTPEPND